MRDKRGGFIFTVYTNDLTGLLIGTGIIEYTPPRSVCKITTERPEVKSVDEDYDYQIWDNYYHFLPLQSETLEIVHIPAECTLISGAVFANTPNLKEIDVEASNNIYDSRDNCNAVIETESNTLVCGISTSTITNTITAIGSRAFEGSTIETVTVPSSVEVIGTNAFARCERLTSAAIAGTVMLGDSVFMGCTALDSISLPVELEQIGKDCFYNCKKLQAVNYEGGLSDWNLIYFDDQSSGIYRMIYSNPLVYASRYYIDNKVVNNMEIPADMDIVFNTTFYGYKGLKTLLVGSNVQSVGKNAFKYCNNLEMIYTAVENPDLVYGANVIENGAPIEVFGDLSNTTVFVPRGLKPTYEACSTFKRAKAIIETDPVADKQRYDTNRDGELNVGDVAALYNALVVSNQDESADLNGDGIINVGDISSIYNAILSGVSFWWK